MRITGHHLYYPPPPRPVSKTKQNYKMGESRPRSSRLDLSDLIDIRANISIMNDDGQASNSPDNSLTVEVEDAESETNSSTHSAVPSSPSSSSSSASSEYNSETETDTEIEENTTPPSPTRPTPPPPPPHKFSERQLAYLDRQYLKLDRYPSLRVFRYLAKQLKVEQSHVERWYHEKLETTNAAGDDLPAYDKPVKKHSIPFDSVAAANMMCGDGSEMVECEIDPCDVVIEVDEDDEDAGYVGSQD